MRLLAFDCTEQSCSVALQSDSSLFERHIEEERQHSKQLLSIIRELLDSASIELAELDGIGFSSGPGSFTGLRIAVSVAQGLGYSHNIPLFPVSSLQALAQSADSCLSPPPGSEILPVLNARMGEIYWARFRSLGGGELQRVEDDRLGKVDGCESQLGPMDGEHKPIIVGSGAPLADPSVTEEQVRLQIRATDMLTLIHEQVRIGRGITAFEAQPAYLRGSGAWKKLDQQGQQ